jgi:hypothetical protein
VKDSSEKTYDVGYKKPPRATRFGKGKSGNPKGRPKKVAERLDPWFILREIEREVVLFPLENGKRKWMTRVEARFRQLFKKALNGDLETARLLVKLAEDYLRPEEGGVQQTNFVVENRPLPLAKP